MNKQNSKTQIKHTKGFVFSLDALFSVFVLIFLIASITFFSSQPYPQSLPQVGLQTKTNDIVVVLDKLGYLSSMDGQNISTYVNGTLDSNVGWKLNVEYYNHTGGINGSFALDQILVLGENTTENNLASATRIFVISDNTSVSYYGNVLMTTWFK